MLVVSGVLRFRSQDVELVRGAVAGIMERSRQDKGCIEYWWAEDLESAGSFRFFECWESQEDFDAHVDQPYEHDFNNDIVSRIIGAKAHRYVVTDRARAVNSSQPEA